jgi:hypothetical protein
MSPPDVVWLNTSPSLTTGLSSSTPYDRPYLLEQHNISASS